MEKFKKQSRRWLCVALALMLISMIGASLIQSDFGKVTIKDIKFETSQGVSISALLFVPENASADSPAPAVVTMHGRYNNKEMQDANSVELSRRGYVVLAPDMPSHGDSELVYENPQTKIALYECVKMLASVSYVDSSRIGITGHSQGGESCNVAVVLDNEAEQQLISAVLINCEEAIYSTDELSDHMATAGITENANKYSTDAESVLGINSGDKTYINAYGSRDVGIIACQYDEFFGGDVDENGNSTLHRDFINYNNAQSFLHFGTDPTGQDKCASYTPYMQNIDGKDTLRIIYNPAIIHPWSHFSVRSTAATIDFFDRAFTAPTPLSADNQVWNVKEAFNALGILGFIIFIFSSAICLLDLPFFASLAVSEPVQPKALDKKGVIWFWGGIIAVTAICAVLFLPIHNWTTCFTQFKDPWAQGGVFSTSVWAAFCGLGTVLVMAVTYICRGWKQGFNSEESGLRLPSAAAVGKTLLLALVVVVLAFSCVFFADYFFKTDFRLWVLGIKPFEARFIGISVFPYMILFLVYFIVNSVSINCFNYNTIGTRGEKGRWVNIAVLAAANALPAVILLAMQYICFFSTGKVFFTSQWFYSICLLWLFPMLILLPAAAVISRKIYQATKNPYLPGIINGVIITLISCTNTLTWR